MKNNLSQLFQNNDFLNLLNAVGTEEFRKVFLVINTYNKRRDEFKKIYNDENDVRIMFFTKILNTLYSYQLERVLINGLVERDEQTRQFIVRTGLNVAINNWASFKISHNLYNAFTCYVRIFSCVESSLRELYNVVNPPTNNSFINFKKIYDYFIDNNSLNTEYKNLFKLLTSIRNLMHNMGVSKDTETITYKNKQYVFTEGQIPTPDVMNLINLLDLYETDILNFATELFNSNSISTISNIPDNLSTRIEDYEQWLSKN